MNIFEQAQKVEFVEFLKLFKRNLEETPEEWGNNDLASFIKGVTGYSLDSVQEELSWRMLSEILLAARVYE
ncbi:DUF7660 family protein [Parapedobacter sp. 10938]|uniref:DUF7660 family protein n=1 Tax=Parapedobacter flavus TaxID=3110225 RepID=UPI002DB9D2CB|nr:hypothetical protein [Parapedobacter sp. 10938]MEC3881429.1 hypothetical protein [Parapedobacter sp. 10938]